MNNDYHVLEKLCKLIGPSGFEKDVQKYFSEIMRPYVTRIKADKLGNTYAEVKGSPHLPKLMFQGHSDTVGFIVKYIDDKGFIFTNDIAGHITTDYRMLPGTDVVILSRRTGKRVQGHFIPTVPLHMLGDEDLKESHSREDLAIDIGASSDIQARNHVDIGDIVVVDSNSRYSAVGHRYIASNLDDRLGLFCMYRIAKAWKRSKIKTKCPVVFVSTVSEENYTGAATVAAYNARPDISITLEPTIATDQIVSDADHSVAKIYGAIALDKGVALGRGLGIDDDVFLCLEKLCKGRRKTTPAIPYQVEPSTDGMENVQIQVAGQGVKTGVIAIPARNCHTRVETISLKDVEHAVNLCLEFCKKVSRGRFG